MPISEVIQALCSGRFELHENNGLTPFGSLLLFKVLHLMVDTLTQLRACHLHAASETTANGLRMSLQRLAQGSHEFTTSLGPIQSQWSPSLVSYHLAQIATRLSLEDLQVVAGRGVKRDVAVRREKVSKARLQ